MRALAGRKQVEQQPPHDGDHEVWLALAGGFSRGGPALLVAAGAALVVLAAAEAATLRR